MREQFNNYKFEKGEWGSIIAIYQHWVMYPTNNYLIIAECNTNATKVLLILLLLWQKSTRFYPYYFDRKSKQNITEAKAGVKSYILLVFALYVFLLPYMMVANH